MDQFDSVVQHLAFALVSSPHFQNHGKLYDVKCCAFAHRRLYPMNHYFCFQGAEVPPEFVMDTLPSLVQHSLHDFGILIQLLEINDPVRVATVQSHFARFKLWAGSLGAHRTSGMRSLIHRLRDSSTIQSHVVSLLEDLQSSLGEG